VGEVMELTRGLYFSIGALMLIGSSEAVIAGGIGSYPAYPARKFPASVAVWTSLVRLGDDNLLGSFLDTDGDRRADRSSFSPLSNPAIGAVDINGPPYPSPSDPSVVYLLVVTGRPEPNREDHKFARFRHVGEQWLLESQIDVPDLIDVGIVDTPAARSSFLSWMGPVAIRRVRGGDSILFASYSISESGFTFWTRIAAFIDGSDSDEFADHWTDVVETDGVDAITMDDHGNVLGRKVRFQPPSGPFTLKQTEAFVTLRDSNGDGLGDRLDPNSVVHVPLNQGFQWQYAYGPADLDVGSDRVVLNSLVPVVGNLDSRGNVVASSLRRLYTREIGDSLFYSSLQPTFGHDGMVIDFIDDGLSVCGPVSDAAAGVWDDLNFDGLTNNGRNSNPLEVRTVFNTCSLPGQTYMGGVAVAELPELDVPATGTRITFADFGDFPNNETFTFRFGGQTYDSVWISPNGVVSFTAPVLGAASYSALANLHGVIAPCWSDRWDTSKLEIYAGLAPVQTSFVTGERALAFAIEWRGLRAPEWDDTLPIEKDRSIAMRLLLYSDGSLRTDFGAFDATEIGSLPLVVGYAGPGAHTTSTATDASAHSWGATWAGTRQERVIGEEFGASHQSDLDHIFVRWAGYPERLDAPGPTPILINPALKNASKVVLTAKNSNIAAGAMLVVDDSEIFALTRSGSGKKWIVGKRVNSQPGNRTVQQIWGDGKSHQILVVNPNGETSDTGSLGP
jgi:hypothetical protein